MKAWLGDRAEDDLFPLSDLLDVPGLEQPDDTAWAMQCVPAAETAEAERTARLFACDCAERALLREREKGREPDPRSWKSIEVARRFAIGEATTDELAAARDAAGAAARDAAGAAARDAAGAAARDAARAAAWAAARDAARAAAWAAEKKWQADHLRELLSGDRELIVEGRHP